MGYMVNKDYMPDSPNVHPYVEVVRISRVNIGPTVQDEKWYVDNGYDVFNLEALSRFPELFNAVLPFLETSYLSYGTKGSKDYRVEEIKICKTQFVQERYSDYFLFKFLEYLYGKSLEDRGYYHLSPQFGMAVSRIAGFSLGMDEYDCYEDNDTALFIYARWF